MADVTHMLAQAVRLHRGGRLEAAEAAYRRILETVPDEPDALQLLGAIARARGENDVAARLIGQAVQLGCDRAEAHYNLGGALLDLGYRAEAVASFQRAVAVRPNYAEACFLLGTTLDRLGQPARAVEALRRAVAIRPDYADAHNNLGNCLLRLGRNEEALACYRRCLELKPDSHEVIGNIGNALKALGHPREAMASYVRAIKTKPEYAEGHNNLGMAFFEQNKHGLAAHCFRKAIALRPDYAEAINNLGIALHALGDSEAAGELFLRAMAQRPSYRRAHSQYLFNLDFDLRQTVASQQIERWRWYKRHALCHATAIRPHRNDRDPERRLKIGYVGADFRQHSAAYVFGLVLRHHDPSRVEVHIYSGNRNNDEKTESFRRGGAVWRDTLRLEDEALTSLIREDGIDILVDLAGHSQGNRLQVFASKAAPVQVSGWGHCNGSGLPTMNGLLADPVYIPPPLRRHFVERVIDLPCVLSYDPPAYAPEVGPLPAIEAGHVTFGCLNRRSKISGYVLGLWAKIMAAVPGSRLLVKDVALDDPLGRKGMLAAMTRRGVPVDRVDLVGATRHAGHLAAYGTVDVALDPYPMSGGTSTLESLWMGVPVVSLAGEIPASRLGAAINHAAGLPDFTAESPEHYVDIAVHVARDVDRLSDLRSRLRGQLAASPICDGPAYAGAVEAVYRDLWRRWCVGGGA
ncbi:MAG: tetratricopeptide repeat protein [Alphaproteobacteria bacterium]